jgi:biopolymer transport protein ExbB/TolQ
LTRKPTRAARARTGYFTGLLLIAAGLAVALGVGWGLVAAGAGLIAYTVLLYDVDDMPERVEREDGPW